MPSRKITAFGISGVTRPLRDRTTSVAYRPILPLLLYMSMNRHITFSLHVIENKLDFLKFSVLVF